jgi:hypothetical protein
LPFANSMAGNPFTPRGAITEAEQFVGRWRELSIIVERIEAGRPVLIAGAPGVGRSSLLYHLTQSAAIHLDDDDLRAYYLNLELAEDAAEVQQVILDALGWRSLAARGLAKQGIASPTAGNGFAALEVALLEQEAPLLLALDNADAAIAAGWGTRLLEGLARLARRSQLILVASVGRVPPQLSEPFSVVNLGAMAATEARLLADAYLSESNVRFSPVEIRELYVLSAGHPAYLQRAAFHLFRAKQEPGYDWRAAYLREARLQPVPGAPLPSEVFEGAERREEFFRFSDGEERAEQAAAPPFELPTLTPLLPLVPLLFAFGAYLLSGNLLLAAAILLLSATVLVVRAKSSR